MIQLWSLIILFHEFEQVHWLCHQQVMEKLLQFWESMMILGNFLIRSCKPKLCSFIISQNKMLRPRVSNLNVTWWHHLFMSQCSDFAGVDFISFCAWYRFNNWKQCDLWVSFPFVFWMSGFQCYLYMALNFMLYHARFQNPCKFCATQHYLTTQSLLQVWSCVNVI